MCNNVLIPHISKLHKKHFTKKCTIHSCRDALPQKSTSPKNKETSCCHNTYFEACTDQLHITVRCVYEVTTIPTSFQPHTPQSIPHPPAIYIIPPTQELHIRPLLAFPQKAPQNKLQRKHFTKKCVIHSYRDALPQKSTSPKTKETSYCHNTYFKACTDY